MTHFSLLSPTVHNKFRSSSDEKVKLGNVRRDFLCSIIMGCVKHIFQVFFKVCQNQQILLVEEAKEAKSVGSEFVTAKEIPADAELASTLLLLPRLAPLMTLMT